MSEVGFGDEESNFAEASLICWFGGMRHVIKIVSGGAAVKNLPANAGDTGDAVLIPGWGRSPGAGTGQPLQYSCLGNPMDRGAWWAAVHGVTESLTRLSAPQKRVVSCYTQWLLLWTDFIIDFKNVRCSSVHDRQSYISGPLFSSLIKDMNLIWPKSRPVISENDSLFCGMITMCMMY